MYDRNIVVHVLVPRPKQSRLRCVLCQRPKSAAGAIMQRDGLHMGSRGRHSERWQSDGRIRITGCPRVGPEAKRNNARKTNFWRTGPRGSPFPCTWAAWKNSVSL